MQNHPPVQVPSLKISERPIWILTYRGLWITVHHCAKRKKTSIICVANLHSLRRGISRVRLTRFKQRWNEDESSSVHRGTVAFTMRVKPRPPRKAAAAAAAAAAIPCQYIREQSQITEKERILREDKIRITAIPGLQTCRKHSFETLIFKYVYIDTIKDVTVKKREQRIGMWNFQYWERESVQNSNINWKENSRVRIGIVFTAEASNLEIGRYSCNPRNISGEDYSTKNDELRKDSLQEYSSPTPWIEHEIITQLQKLDWQQKEKNVKKVYYRRKTNTFFTILDVFRHQGQRSRSN